MAWTTPYTFTALELLTAAKLNTMQDNLSALWVGTTAGDTDYYVSATGKSRLAIGTAYQFKQVNSAGTAPQWGGLHFCNIFHSTTQNLTTGTPTALLCDSDHTDAQGWHSTSVNTSRVTVTATGYYQAAVSINYSAVGGAGTYWDIVALRVNGTEQFLQRVLQEVDANDKDFSVCFPIVYLTATQYLEIYLTQNSGGTRATQILTFSVLRVA